MPVSTSPLLIPLNIGMLSASRKALSASGQRPGGVPKWSRWKEVVAHDAAACIIFRDHDLMQLFAGADANELAAATRRDRFRDIDDPRARDLRNEYFAPAQDLKTAQDEIDALIQGFQKGGHALIRDRDLSRFPPIEKRPADAAPVFQPSLQRTTAKRVSPLPGLDVICEISQCRSESSPRPTVPADIRRPDRP
jgi:hypothetical protein